MHVVSKYSLPIKVAWKRLYALGFRLQDAKARPNIWYHKDKDSSVAISRAIGRKVYIEILGDD